MLNYPFECFTKKKKGTFLKFIAQLSLLYLSVFIQKYPILLDALFINNIDNL
jgi:hypothetical protein